MRTVDSLKKFALASVAFAFLMVGLSMLPPLRQSHAQFPGQQLYGGTSTGTATAQAITIPNYTTHTFGVVISFLVGPGLTNGPSSTGVTIAISGLPAVNLYRITPTGTFPMRGGELQAGVLAQIMWDGTEYQQINNTQNDPIGSTKMWHFNTASMPKGWLVADGSCISQANYAELFNLFGTTYNSVAPSACSGSTFAIPFMNGTFAVTADNQGSFTASRVTSGGSGCNAVVGNTAICGTQTHTMALAELAAHTHGLNTVNDVAQTGGGTRVTGSGGSTQTSSTGSATPFSIIPPAYIVLRMIKF